MPQQYAEADPTETDRIVDSMHRFISLANAMLKDNFTGLIQHGDDNFDGGEFGLARTHELPLSFQWLYDHYPNGNEALLLETMELMFAGGRQGGYVRIYTYILPIFLIRFQNMEICKADVMVCAFIYEGLDQLLCQGRFPRSGLAGATRG